MVTQIDLKYFKCFEVLHLPLAPLTLLSGGNASGKSSVLQALVLLHQTMREYEWSTRLMLNGPSLRMGTVADVVDKVNGRYTFEIGVVDMEHSYQWIFTAERSEMSLAVDSVTVSGVINDHPASLRYLIPLDVSEEITSLPHRLRSLTYITAERVGPREIYPLEDSQVVTTVGPTGEYAASILHHGRNDRVLDSLTLPEVPPTRLRQIEARMRLFFPGCSLDVQQIPQTNAVRLGMRTSEDTDFHRPFHVGFGLTQVLPIVIATLSASEEDILLIENPEVHLHPAGQARMGQFLADVALSGVQVIVETHSDHVLNGIRRSVRAKKLSPEQVAIHFFRPRSADAPQVITPQLDIFGNLDIWPEGFFDQFDKDASHFAGWGE